MAVDNKRHLIGTKYMITFPFLLLLLMGLVSIKLASPPKKVSIPRKDQMPLNYIPRYSTTRISYRPQRLTPYIIPIIVTQGLGTFSAQLHSRGIRGCRSQRQYTYFCQLCLESRQRNRLTKSYHPRSRCNPSFHWILVEAGW